MFGQDLFGAGVVNPGDAGQVPFSHYEHAVPTGQAFGSAPRESSSGYSEFLTAGSSPGGYVSQAQAQAQAQTRPPTQGQPRDQQRRMSGWDPATAFAAEWEPIPCSSSSSSFTPAPSASSDWGAAAFLGHAVPGPSNHHQHHQGPADVDVHMANATMYSGSDGLAGVGRSAEMDLPAYQYDLQENVALLSSFGLISQSLKEQSSVLQRGSGVGPGVGDGVHGGGGSASGGASGMMGGGGGGGAQVLNPGAVELGLSGESRLDSGWLAFMKDCGILGSPDGVA